MDAVYWGRRPAQQLRDPRRRNTKRCTQQHALDALVLGVVIGSFETIRQRYIAGGRKGIECEDVTLYLRWCLEQCRLRRVRNARSGCGESAF